jgi:hypothetical protein
VSVSIVLPVVVASARHVDTDYDAMLISRVDRDSARAQVLHRAEDVVNAWCDGVAMLDEKPSHRGSIRGRRGQTGWR